MSLFEKAWEIAKLDPYEMAVAEKFSDPRDFMTPSRMREALAAMDPLELHEALTHPMGDLDFRFLDIPGMIASGDSVPDRIATFNDDDVRDAYKQVMQLKGKGVKKADGTVSSGTPGTNNPMHSRPSGYESGGIFDPTKKKRKPGKKRPIGDKRRQQEGIKPDAPRLLAENKRKLGDVIQNSTTNLLYALGLFTK